MIILIGTLNSAVLTLLIVLSYFRGYKFITNRVILFTMTDVYCAFAFSVMIVALVVLIFSTRFNDLFFNFIRRHRKPIQRERDRLLPLIEEIQKNIQSKFHKKRINVVLKIKDEDTYNASAVGVKTVAINRKLYEDYDDTVLKAIIAHQLSHIYNFEGCKGGIFLVLTSMFSITLGALWIVAVVSWAFGRESRNGVISRLIGLSSYLIAIIAAGLVLCGITGYFMFHLSLKICYRRMDYKADQFAVALGYKEGLMKFLEENKSNDYLLNSWIAHLLNVHPKKILRIGNIERQDKFYAW
ncbi:MAG: M48 family metalloprotease [Lentisphaerota bacterium]